MRSAGFVLVGGRSTRMGRDKAMLPWGGSTLVELVAHKVAEAAGQVMLIGDPVRYAHLPFEVQPDSRPGCGPLAGVEVALRLNRGEWNLIVACDLPSIETALMKSLFSEALSAPAQIQAVVPETPDGRLQPLCAVYRQSCLPQVETALAARQFRLTELVSSLNILRHFGSPEAAFLNVNTPADWSALGAPQTP